MDATKAMELATWGFPTLIVPLVTIAAVIFVQWLTAGGGDWKDVIRDGQVCFYAVAILAGSWYELGRVPPPHTVTGTLGTISLFLAIAAFSYGILVLDNQNAKKITKEKSAFVSICVG